VYDQVSAPRCLTRDAALDCLQEPITHCSSVVHGPDLCLADSFRERALREVSVVCAAPHQITPHCCWQLM